MLRIVGVQRSSQPEQEFILLQNQGSMRVVLRGLMLVHERSIETGDLAQGAFVFRDTEVIPPGLFVMLSTGCGTPHWTRTKDGAHVFRTYIGSRSVAWSRSEGPIHILSPHHSYVERGELLMLR